MSEASGRGRACLANATRLLDGKLVVPIPAQRCRHGRCDDEPHWPGQPGRARWRGQPLPQRSPHFGALQRIGGARKKWLWTVLLAKADILGHGRDEVCPCEEAVGTAAESVDVVRVLRRRVAAYTGSCSYRRLAFRRRGYGCPQCRRRSHHTHTWEVSRQRDEGDEKHLCRACCPHRLRNFGSFSLERCFRYLERCGSYVGFLEKKTRRGAASSKPGRRGGVREED